MVGIVAGRDGRAERSRGGRRHACKLQLNARSALASSPCARVCARVCARASHSCSAAAHRACVEPAAHAQLPQAFLLAPCSRARALPLPYALSGPAAGQPGPEGVLGGQPPGPSPATRGQGMARTGNLGSGNNNNRESQWFSPHTAWGVDLGSGLWAGLAPLVSPLPGQGSPPPGLNAPQGSTPSLSGPGLEI